MDFPYPLTTVGALVVNPQGEVLIVKTTKWRGTWGVPGGKVDYGESLEAALIREFQEEVGLTLSQIEFAVLQEAIDDPQFCRPAHFVLVNYFARTDETTVIPNEEIVEWCWLPPEEALTYPLNTFTVSLVKQFQRR